MGFAYLRLRAVGGEQDAEWGRRITCAEPARTDSHGAPLSSKTAGFIASNLTQLASQHRPHLLEVVDALRRLAQSPCIDRGRAVPGAVLESQSRKAADLPGQMTHRQFKP